VQELIARKEFNIFRM